MMQDKIKEELYKRLENLRLQLPDTYVLDTKKGIAIRKNMDQRQRLLDEIREIRNRLEEIDYEERKDSMKMVQRDDHTIGQSIIENSIPRNKSNIQFKDNTDRNRILVKV